MNIKDAKIGGFITAHHKGIHKIVSIEPNNGSNGLVHYITVLNDKGHKVNSNREKCCDVSYCETAFDYFVDQEQKFKELKRTFIEMGIIPTY